MSLFNCCLLLFFLVDTGYFDVDTMTVLTRCYKTLIPTEDYVSDVLGGVPDLYGSSI